MGAPIPAAFHQLLQSRCPNGPTTRGGTRMSRRRLPASAGHRGTADVATTFEGRGPFELPARTPRSLVIGAKVPFETRDRNVVAATSLPPRSEAHTHHVGWVAKYAPDQETVGYLDHVIPGPTSIMDLAEASAAASSTRFLRYEDGPPVASPREVGTRWSGRRPRGLPGIVACRLGSGKTSPDRATARPRPPSRQAQRHLRRDTDMSVPTPPSVSGGMIKGTRGIHGHRLRRTQVRDADLHGPGRRGPRWHAPQYRESPGRATVLRRQMFTRNLQDHRGWPSVLLVGLVEANTYALFERCSPLRSRGRSPVDPPAVRRTVCPCQQAPRHGRRAYAYVRGEPQRALPVKTSQHAFRRGPRRSPSRSSSRKTTTLSRSRSASWVLR